MVDEALRQPIHVWVQMPSCVPAAPGFETPGAVIGPQDVAQAMKWDGIIGLGEMMNYHGVINGDEKLLEEMAVTRKAGKVIGGHYASQDLGNPFHAYAAAGAQDDHEGTRSEDAIARVRQGMKAMLRYGSGWQDVAAQAKAITKLHLDPRHFILCTDDSHAGTLSQEGHMDRVLRHAIQEGLPPMTAIQMATINTAEHFGLSGEIGMIAPGRWADVLLVEDLREFYTGMTIAKGQVIAENGEMKIDLPAISHPEWATQSVHLKRLLTRDDFRLHAPVLNPALDKVTANVIGVVENQALTRHLRLEVPVNDNEVHVDMKRDLAKIALIERHHGSGSVTVGLVHGFGFTKPCAVASTVAHDSHQMLVLGTDEDSMTIAANRLAEVGGGQVVVKEGQVAGMVELSIGGLMSTGPAAAVARKVEAVLEGFRACGCKLNNANMQLSLLALVVIPELRISDKGLVDVKHFAFVPVLEHL